jgi:ABC-type spermidine/putrescine transport system permease subunit II
VVAARFDVRLLEVAADLGAGGWRRFRDIEAPLLLPGILSAGFFGFLLSLNELPRSTLTVFALRLLFRREAA